MENKVNPNTENGQGAKEKNVNSDSAKVINPSTSKFTPKEGKIYGGIDAIITEVAKTKYKVPEIATFVGKITSCNRVANYDRVRIVGINLTNGNSFEFWASDAQILKFDVLNKAQSVETDKAETHITCNITVRKAVKDVTAWVNETGIEPDKVTNYQFVAATFAGYDATRLADKLSDKIMNTVAEQETFKMVFEFANKLPPEMKEIYLRKHGYM